MEDIKTRCTNTLAFLQHLQDALTASAHLGIGVKLLHPLRQRAHLSCILTFKQAEC